ncbi:MAG: hypothetical protein JNK56_39455 [Myxococcales bacterium]|nr:hypothetical protein [Myxococcales bacterium]
MIELLTPAPAPMPAPIASDPGLQPGDRVAVTVHDWLTGDHELIGKVRRIEANGRVIVDVAAGTQAMRLSCDAADVAAVAGPA